MSDIQECICGADIRQERGREDWFNVNDNQGTALYCYPDAEGNDGRAVHEPLESDHFGFVKTNNFNKTGPLEKEAPIHEGEPQDG
jgi:hypothetical protein